MKVVHIVLNNSFDFGTISIWPTYKKLGLSAFQNSQMNWLINLSSPWLISWWIDDLGHRNKFKYAWNDELKNFPWWYLTMSWGCFLSKALLMIRWTRVSLGNKPQTPWLSSIKMMNWDTWEAYLMGKSFGNHCHACLHLLLAISLHKGSPRSFWPCDCSNYKQKMLVTYFCAK